MAKVVDTSSNAVWNVKFFKIISVKYLILDLDPNYQWVVVGHPSRRYGWIMARTKTMDAPLYQRLLGDLAVQGYDPAKFQKVPQSQAGTTPAPAGAATTH
jgi:apolipoprotein D and lipocalin family protein